MSDFDAGTCDFHSDFRPESNDYASDFRDFPGDFSGDFGGAPRTAKQPPETPETAPPEQGTAAGKAKWEQWRRQATEQRTTPLHKAINNGRRTIGAAV